MKKRASQRLVPRVRPPLLVLLLVLLVLTPPACRRPLLSLSECMRVATVTRPFIVIHHPIMSCCISRARTGRLGVVLLLLQTMHIDGHQRRDRTEVLRARGSAAAAVPAIHKIVRPLTMYRRRLRGRRGGRNDVHAQPYMIVPAVEGLPHHYRQTLRVVAIHTLVPMHLMLILFGLLLLLLLLMFMTARFPCRSRCRCRRQQGRHRQRRVRHQL